MWALSLFQSSLIVSSIDILEHLKEQEESSQMLSEYYPNIKARLHLGKFDDDSFWFIPQR